MVFLTSKQVEDSSLTSSLVFVFSKFILPEFTFLEEDLKFDMYELDDKSDGVIQMGVRIPILSEKYGEDCDFDASPVIKKFYHRKRSIMNKLRETFSTSARQGLLELLIDRFEVHFEKIRCNLQVSSVLYNETEPELLAAIEVEMIIDFKVEDKLMNEPASA